jgi:prevent-host-death family protein
MPERRLTVDLVHYIVYNRTMIRVNVHDAKTNFSKYLDAAASGETVIVCRRNVPVAELRPIPTQRRVRPPLGKSGDGFHVPDSFFEPLPEDVLHGFTGENE